MADEALRPQKEFANLVVPFCLFVPFFRPERVVAGTFQRVGHLREFDDDFAHEHDFGFIPEHEVFSVQVHGFLRGMVVERIEIDERRRMAEHQ